MLTRLTHYNAALTRADLWKSLALLLMLIDHIGWLFFPDDLVWRAIGRACVPIWCFFIGYHCVSREGDPLKSSWLEMKPLLIGTAVCLAVNLITGIQLIPLPILTTFIAIKWLLKQEEVIKALTQHTYEWLFALAFLAIPSIYFLEYGTPALLLACVGYLVKRGWCDEGFAHAQRYHIFAALTLALFLVLQWGNFEFSLAQFALMCALTLPIALGLWRYEPSESTLSPSTQHIATLLKLGGRYTLEFYVIHKAVLQVIAIL